MLLLLSWRSSLYQMLFALTSECSSPDSVGGQCWHPIGWAAGSSSLISLYVKVIEVLAPGIRQHGVSHLAADC